MHRKIMWVQCTGCFLGLIHLVFELLFFQESQWQIILIRYNIDCEDFFESTPIEIGQKLVALHMFEKLFRSQQIHQSSTFFWNFEFHIFFEHL